jgi:hypothetical protein
MFTNHFNLVSRLRLSGVIPLRPMDISMACTSTNLPYLLPLLTRLVHATSNILRIFSRLVALLCNHCYLILGLAPNVSKQNNTTCFLNLPAASRLKQVLQFISPTFPQSLGLWSQVWVTNCRYRSGGKRLWPILGMAYCSTYRSFATTMSQLKIYDFSGEILKDFEVL